LWLSDGRLAILGLSGPLAAADGATIDTMWTTRRGVRPAVRLAVEIGTLALAVHLMLPQIAGLGATGEALAHATWWRPLSVIVLEATSLAAYGELMVLTLRRAGESVSCGFVQRSVVGLSLGSHAARGTTTALAMITAAFRHRGVDPAKTATAMGASGGLSTVILAALPPIGTVFALTTGHVASIALSAMIAAVTVVVASFALLGLRNPDALATWPSGSRGSARPAAPSHEPRHRQGTALRSVSGARALASDRPTLIRAAAWATVNWLLDIAVVLVLAMALGRGVHAEGFLRRRPRSAVTRTSACDHLVEWCGCGCTACVALTRRAGSSGAPPAPAA
jgi:uncharacterized membrane protein YbhN (UPF0104 family)